MYIQKITIAKLFENLTVLIEINRLRFVRFCFQSVFSFVYRIYYERKIQNVWNIKGKI